MFSNSVVLAADFEKLLEASRTARRANAAAAPPPPVARAIRSVVCGGRKGLKMVISLVTRALILILGYAYPAYDCYKAVELNRPEVAQLRFWCQYWILLAVLTVFERVGDNFISWLPMYSEAKLAFIVYLWYPKTQGTAYVYESFFKPYIGKHEAEIDRNLLELRTRAGDMAVHYFQKVADYSQTRFYEILQYIASQSQTQRSHPQPQRHQQRPPPPQTRQLNPGPPPLPTPSALPLTPQQAQAPPSSPRNQAQADRAPMPVAPPGAMSPPATPGHVAVTGTNATHSTTEATQAANPPTSNAHHAPVIPDEETLIQEAIRMTRSRLRRRVAGATDIPDGLDDKIISSLLVTSFSAGAVPWNNSKEEANASLPFKLKTATHMSAVTLKVLVERRVSLVNDVKEMLRTASGGRETLATVDHLRRLCIDHYFQDEVDNAMDDIACLQELAHGGDLHDATLAFRLMREAGHHVSPDEVLGRFIDDINGEFDLAYSKDIGGLLGLHDISHMNIGAETLLYKANEFSTKQLKSTIKQLNPNLAKYVKQSLDHPYHISLMQYKARHHLSYLQTLPTRCTAMEELALADFQLNKLLHQMEMQEIKRWWLDLGLAQEIPVARDQVQKWYVWVMTVIEGASSSRYRIELSKVAAFVYIVDDIFDLVGTQDELSCFTQAIKMWDIAAADSLPSCMRSCYMALYTLTNDIADLVKIEHGVNPINHLKTAWAILFDAFMKETKWLSAGHVADLEDYLRNGVLTSGIPLVYVHLLFMLGHDLEKDALGFIDHIPPVIFRSAKILRLWDDLGSAKDEAQEGLDGSYKELYLKENPWLSAGEAEEHMHDLVAREWEELNRECFSKRAFSGDFTKAALNVSRMVAVMYAYDGEEQRRLPILDDYIKMLLF
ncbi:hypothetical protein GUJ93_ZPchr0002g24019 [Zizania palustris]|uniref:Uncharacterized protein n=1 Tax=Zizania palustris TaxID=103762 RepID=A0A8J5RNV9_ZIZPA|nr:hypothetical protein GUJ93_ZPchr0002g24019 [Zizania palustris]